MRLLSIIFLVIVVAVVAVFAWQNHEEVSLRFFEWGFAIPLAALIAVVYLLGMVSGWSLWRALRRSFIRATEHKV
jgi:putative membrane protein